MRAVSQAISRRDKHPPPSILIHQAITLRYSICQKMQEAGIIADGLSVENIRQMLNFELQGSGKLGLD